MKKKIILFCLCLFSPLFAEEFDLVDFYEGAPAFQPFGITASYVNVSKTNFTTEGFENKHLRYIQTDAAFSYTYPFDPCSGLILGMAWVGTEVDMQDNPHFNETDFNYVTFSLGGFTSACAGWFWTATLSLLIDTQSIDLADYVLYQGVLWGKYQYTPSFEFDVGLIIEAGLKQESVWPILGFTYNFKKYTRLHVVYPVDITWEYDLLKSLTIAGSLRFLRNRHRVSADNPTPQAIFEYRTTGAEIDLLFSPCKWISVRGFLGSTFKGDFKIANSDNHFATHYKFNGSFYAGVSSRLSY